MTEATTVFAGGCTVSETSVGTRFRGCRGDRLLPTVARSVEERTLLVETRLGAYGGPVEPEL